MDVDAYLERIGYTGTTTPVPQTLRNLQRAHLFTVPFENLDIGWKRSIVIDRQAFIRKIVQARRGGFCYELNGAFAALLEALGFDVTLLSARAPTAQGTPGPEYDHLALRVDLDEPWLADVGFGNSFVDPLRLKDGIEQKQNTGSFRIIEVGDDLRLERTEPEGSWKTEYLFNLTPRRLEEFAGMCHFHQTSPESPFTRKRVCSRATPEGRITLSEMKLIETRNGIREERVLKSDDDWWATLREDFGVLF
jgi:N-hydroxyarylamine O-acetyltransferase